MTEFDSVITPRRSLRRFIVDHNPFFLLSAVCMLGGCLVLTNSLSWSPIRLQRLVLLVVTLNIYELMLIGLALFLIVKRRLRRDGTILLILEAFFLVDVTFLNAELFAASLAVGTIANSILLALAVLKVTAIFVGLGISPRNGAYPLILLEMAMLFAMPGIFKQLATHHGGALSAHAIYAAWWVLAIIPVIATLLFRSNQTGNEPARPRAEPQRHAGHPAIGMLMTLPAISLLAHVSTSNWIYNVRWYPANVSPLILGLAVAIGSYDRHVISLCARMRSQFALPMLAVLISARFPSLLTFDFAGIGFSPLRFALAGAILVYLHGLWLHRHLYFAWAAATCALTGLFGASPPEIGENMTYVGKETATFGWSMIPRTARQVGIMSIATSFVLLALGAVVSLFKEAPSETDANGEFSQ